MYLSFVCEDIKLSSMSKMQRTPSILAVHVVEDAGRLLPVVVVIDGDQGVLGLLDGHHVPQGDVNTSLLAGHLIEI